MIEATPLQTIEVSGYTLPQAWERSIAYLWELGILAPDAHARPGVPSSVDGRMILTIQDPAAEPSIHRGLPGGVGDLETYALEVVYGINDHLVIEGKLPYTYHDRLTNYPVLLREKESKWTRQRKPWPVYIDQISQMIITLAKDPGSRRAQAITWIPWLDIDHPNPPCLQRIWARILDNRLCVGLHWRSRDAYNAAFMNLWAFVQWAKKWASALSWRLNKDIKLGPLVDISDSYHIRGVNTEDCRTRFLPLLKGRTLADRVWSMDETREIREEAAREAGWTNGCFV